MKTSKTREIDELNGKWSTTSQDEKQTIELSLSENDNYFIKKVKGEKNESYNIGTHSWWVTKGFLRLNGQREFFIKVQNTNTLQFGEYLSTDKINNTVLWDSVFYRVL